MIWLPQCATTTSRDTLEASLETQAGGFTVSSMAERKHCLRRHCVWPTTHPHWPDHDHSSYNSHTKYLPVRGSEQQRKRLTPVSQRQHTLDNTALKQTMHLGTPGGWLLPWKQTTRLCSEISQNCSEMSFCVQVNHDYILLQINTISQQ